MAIERIWTDEDVLSIAATVTSLRKMRTAATSVSQPLTIRLKNLVQRPPITFAPQEVLAEAEGLADTAARFYAARLLGADTPLQREEWQEGLVTAEKKYRPFQTATFANSSLNDAVGNSLIGRMRNLRVDPEYMLQYDLTQNNNLGVTEVAKLKDHSLGIISPLSGDYLVMSTYAEYFRQSRNITVAVRAAILSQDLQWILLPEDAPGVPAFQDKEEIGMYIDTTETGQTARALQGAIEQQYPSQKIHRHSLQPREFQKSKRMERFWKENA